MSVTYDKAAEGLLDFGLLTLPFLLPAFVGWHRETFLVEKIWLLMKNMHYSSVVNWSLKHFHYQAD